VSDIAIAALLAGTILVASMVSIEIGISVALIELFAGIVVGNAFNLAVPVWLAFVGSFAGGTTARPRSPASPCRRRASPSSTRSSSRPGSIASWSASG